MLVLTRKVGQQIRIGDDVVVTVTKIQGNQVWLGLEGPDWVRFVRYELTDKGRLKPFVPKPAAKGPLGRFLPKRRVG